VSRVRRPPGSRGRAKLEQYAQVGMVGGSPHPTLISAAQPTSPGLIGAMPEGGAQAIASRGMVPSDNDLLDHAAMESGTD